MGGDKGSDLGGKRGGNKMGGGKRKEGREMGTHGEESWRRRRLTRKKKGW